MWQQYWRCCNDADSGGGGCTNAGGVDEATAVPAACWTMWQQYWRCCNDADGGGGGYTNAGGVDEAAPVPAAC
jgi:hypothetical protein